MSDILENIRDIQAFTRGVSFEEFLADTQKLRAVERCFEIIGEAARHVPADIQARHPDVPWEDMYDMRNVISHVYFKVSRKIMWNTIQNELSPLVPKLRAILEREGESGGAA